MCLHTLWWRVRRNYHKKMRNFYFILISFNFSTSCTMFRNLPTAESSSQMAFGLTNGRNRFKADQPYHLLNFSITLLLLMKIDRKHNSEVGTAILRKSQCQHASEIRNYFQLIIYARSLLTVNVKCGCFFFKKKLVFIHLFKKSQHTHGLELCICICI